MREYDDIGRFDSERLSHEALSAEHKHTCRRGMESLPKLLNQLVDVSELGRCHLRALQRVEGGSDEASIDR